ncbi:GGDEF domain-containing protein [Methylobacterium sp. BTF04]|uniref:GGDEF domain-containing protein n=1 Tax=Methylobacterium sp. BTF04 TaxID=2708300 RepID=UPI0013D32376|nr:GGDEF domain-containing protein [Methylobacterium sp. BTF04]NEU10589.1 GGDEF domain-containing protein [Methylobacterium sp. BTF04]
MRLDAPTLLLVTVILTFTVGSLFLLSWSQARAMRALAIWGVAHLVGASASALLSLRGVIPDWASIGLANALIIGAYGLIWSGTRAFEGRPAWLAPVVGSVALWGGACLIPDFFASLPARVILASALAGLFCLAAGIEVWRGRAEPLLSRWPAMILLGGYTLAYWVRIPLAMVAPSPPPGYNPLQSQWLAILCCAGMLFTLSIAFVFMALTKERAERLQRLAADTDPLTGIASRRAFVAGAQAILAQRDRTATLLLFDLDHFKRINDAYGHAVGDGVLVGFCHTAQALLPTGAVFGRMGGEEFACLVPDLAHEDALAAAELIRRAVSGLRVPAFPRLAVSVSIGAATNRTWGRDLDTLLRTADAALYRAKRKGRDRVELSVPTLDQAA